MGCPDSSGDGGGDNRMDGWTDREVADRGKGEWRSIVNKHPVQFGE